MSLPVFNITQDDLTSIEWLQCRLFIEMNPHHLCYTVLDEKNTVVAVKYYQLSYNSNQEMVNMLEETWHEDPVLKEKMKHSLVLFNWPENCLVPYKYFNKGLNKEILELLHGNVNMGMMMSEKIVGGAMYTIYRIPPVLDDFFQRRFPDCTYSHYYSVWIDSIFRQEENATDHVRIVFNQKEITAAVFTNKQLQVVQNLPYQTTEDIAWTLLNIYQQFNLKQEETPLLVGGMIDQNSAMFEELLKYFQWVKVDVMPDAVNLPEQFHSYPQHFFSPLLKLALCVS